MKCYNHPDVEAIGTCTSCGKAICSDCSIEVGGKLMCKPCVEKLAARCGAAQAVSRKEPALALLLSLVGGLVCGLLAGLGQVYNGQIKKAIILSVAYFVAWVVVVLLMFVLVGFCLIPLPFCLWLYAMYDAYTTAEKLNRGEPVKDWLE